MRLVVPTTFNPLRPLNSCGSDLSEAGSGVFGGLVDERLLRTGRTFSGSDKVAVDGHGDPEPESEIELD